MIGCRVVLEELNAQPFLDDLEGNSRCCDRSEVFALWDLENPVMPSGTFAERPNQTRVHANQRG